MAVPKLTAEQRADALKKAGEARKKRAELREQLSKREITIQDVFLRCNSGDETVSRTPIHSILTALPGYGSTKTDALLEVCNISPNRRVRGVGEKQRERLLQQLGVIKK